MTPQSDKENYDALLALVNKEALENNNQGPRLALVELQTELKWFKGQAQIQREAYLRLKLGEVPVEPGM